MRIPLSLGLCSFDLHEDLCVIRLLASLRVLHMSRGEIPYPHRGEPMDAERDHAADDRGKQTSSSFVLFLLLFPCAIRTQGQPTLARATGGGGVN